MKETQLQQYRRNIGKHHAQSYKEFLRALTVKKRVDTVEHSYDGNKVLQESPVIYSNEVGIALVHLLQQLGHRQNIPRNMMMLLCVSLVVLDLPNKVDAQKVGKQNNEGRISNQDLFVNSPTNTLENIGILSSKTKARHPINTFIMNEYKSELANVPEKIYLKQAQSIIKDIESLLPKVCSKEALNAFQSKYLLKVKLVHSAELRNSHGDIYPDLEKRTFFIRISIDRAALPKHYIINLLRNECYSLEIAIQNLEKFGPPPLNRLERISYPFVANGQYELDEEKLEQFEQAIANGIEKVNRVMMNYYLYPKLSPEAKDEIEKFKEIILKYSPEAFHEKVSLEEFNKITRMENGKQLITIPHFPNPWGEGLVSARVISSVPHKKHVTYTYTFGYDETEKVKAEAFFLDFLIWHSSLTMLPYPSAKEPAKIAEEYASTIHAMSKSVREFFFKEVIDYMKEFYAQPTVEARNNMQR